MLHIKKAITEGALNIHTVSGNTWSMKSSHSDRTLVQPKEIHFPSTFKAIALKSETFHMI